MAKAVGRPSPVDVKTAPRDHLEIVELAARLVELGRAQEEARDAVGESDPNYAAAFERLFIAVARLNPSERLRSLRSLERATWRPVDEPPGLA